MAARHHAVKQWTQLGLGCVGGIRQCRDAGDGIRLTYDSGDRITVGAAIVGVTSAHPELVFAIFSQASDRIAGRGTGGVVDRGLSLQALLHLVVGDDTGGAVPGEGDIAIRTAGRTAEAGYLAGRRVVDGNRDHRVVAAAAGGVTGLHPVAIGAVVPAGEADGLKE